MLPSKHWRASGTPNQPMAAGAPVEAPRTPAARLVVHRCPPSRGHLLPTRCVVTGILARLSASSCLCRWPHAGKCALTACCCADQQQLVNASAMRCRRETRHWTPQWPLCGVRQSWSCRASASALCALHPTCGNTASRSPKVRPLAGALHAQTCTGAERRRLDSLGAAGAQATAQQT
jgi:hypothetical protein